MRLFLLLTISFPLTYSYGNIESESWSETQNGATLNCPPGCTGNGNTNIPQGSNVNINTGGSNKRGSDSKRPYWWEGDNNPFKECSPGSPGCRVGQSPSGQFRPQNANVNSNQTPLQIQPNCAPGSVNCQVNRPVNPGDCIPGRPGCNYDSKDQFTDIVIDIVEDNGPLASNFHRQPINTNINSRPQKTGSTQINNPNAASFPGDKFITIETNDDQFQPPNILIEPQPTDSFPSNRPNIQFKDSPVNNFNNDANRRQDRFPVSPGSPELSPLPNQYDSQTGSNLNAGDSGIPHQSNGFGIGIRNRPTQHSQVSPGQRYENPSKNNVKQPNVGQLPTGFLNFPQQPKRNRDSNANRPHSKIPSHTSSVGSIHSNSGKPEFPSHSSHQNAPHSNGASFSHSLSNNPNQGQSNVDNFPDAQGIGSNIGQQGSTLPGFKQPLHTSPQKQTPQGHTGSTFTQPRPTFPVNLSPQGHGDSKFKQPRPILPLSNQFNPNSDGANLQPQNSQTFGQDNNRIPTYENPRPLNPGNVGTQHFNSQQPGISSSNPGPLSNSESTFRQPQRNTNNVQPNRFVSGSGSPNLGVPQTSFPLGNNQPGRPSHSSGNQNFGQQGQFAPGNIGNQGFEQPSNVPNSNLGFQSHSGSENRPVDGLPFIQDVLSPQDLRPISTGMSLGGMQMMMMPRGMNLIGGACSAGSFCVEVNTCNPYNGFIIRDISMVAAVQFGQPQVPLVRCELPAVAAADRVCCQEAHPIAGTGAD